MVIRCLDERLSTQDLKESRRRVGAKQDNGQGCDWGQNNLIRLSPRLWGV
ncbi:hypothetical protein TIFTF001_016902 [Ficus carica]|uniref:Uncharacterized protein n=1 Tax=Ficus carica TaxID=3494 RepID=A0AA88AB69_FICCA|nr:hypothetical protein TIFTF001_016902 [Ficus carica]